jgi:hypothetical protein
MIGPNPIIVQELLTPEDIILRLFQDMLLTHGMPVCVVNIHLRVSRSAFDNCVSCGKAQDPLPDPPFTSYMQAAIDVQTMVRHDVGSRRSKIQLLWSLPARLPASRPCNSGSLRLFPCARSCRTWERGPRNVRPPKDSAVNHCPASISKNPKPPAPAVLTSDRNAPRWPLPPRPPLEQEEEKQKESPAHPPANHGARFPTPPSARPRARAPAHTHGPTPLMHARSTTIPSDRNQQRTRQRARAPGTSNAPAHHPNIQPTRVAPPHSN